MRNLNRIALSPFDSRRISMDHLLAFATDHFERLRAKNPNDVFSERISTTESALDALRDALSADLTHLGNRKGSEVRKNRFRVRLRSESGRVAGGLISHFGGDSPKISRVFPEGRTVLNTASDDRLGDHLEVMVEGVVALQPELPPETGSMIVELATGLRDSWAEIHAESESATGKKSATARRLRDARAGLSWVLWENVMSVAAAFPREPKMMEEYFQQSLLG